MDDCRNCWTCKHYECVPMCCHNEPTCYLCGFGPNYKWSEDIAAWLEIHEHETRDGPDHAFWGPSIDAPPCPGWEQGPDHRPKPRRGWHA